ncbi:GspH/FimT family pseudopilin [Alkalilimnicola sp. S0819]|uniref:GspH/FimT family pseudopilin n=1 Tax=Alkalilimnicola sp. S0819 TaxID=2613922 RepID=UPI001261456D|nr:GspH/FimT family pseudopilin [Alkalilimnicola sp. S0819]KAB7623156.1 type II secretion system protein GspH [Alkalilimnicola sp. S0819]MPQ17000.1 type II secretion system protein GspH [Alkalilimnicola sp. S0819]
MKTTNGFTLIELMVVVALLGIVVAIAVPSFTDIVRDNRITTQANDMLAALNLARSEAIKRNQRVSVCPSSNLTNCSGGTDWSVGWIVFTDANGNGAVDAGTDTVLKVWDAPAGAPNITGPGQIRYAGNGMLDQAAAQTIVHRAKGCSNTEQRRITVALTGRPGTTNEACS